MMNMKEAVKWFSKIVMTMFGSCTIPTNEEGRWEINVEFINSDGEPDETQFDILPYRLDYGRGVCEELEELWKNFCKENNFHQNSIMQLHFAGVH